MPEPNAGSLSGRPYCLLFSQFSLFLRFSRKSFLEKKLFTYYTFTILSVVPFPPLLKGEVLWVGSLFMPLSSTKIQNLIWS
jgi:hypothetical protein